MEKTLVVLLLLCALSSADRKPSKEEPQQCSPCLSDIHTVLRDLSTRLGKYEVEMEHQKKVIQEQATKLETCEKKTSDVDTIKKDLQEQAIKLETCEKKTSDVDTIKKDLQAQTTELQSIRSQTETLRKDKEVGQVAFSASLLTSGQGYTGPFNTFTPLVFRNVISNIGNAYNPNTGYFIAPVRGAYHFEFYIASLHSHSSGAVLVKNGQHVVIAYESETKGWGQKANAATLLLEVNDVVSLRLWAHTRIHENGNRHNTFSGRLLFTLG